MTQLKHLPTSIDFSVADIDCFHFKLSATCACCNRQFWRARGCFKQYIHVNFIKPKKRGGVQWSEVKCESSWIKRISSLFCYYVAFLRPIALPFIIEVL